MTLTDAARQVCQEARMVLVSLRGGPPVIARGELAHDLMELRDRCLHQLERKSVWPPEIPTENKTQGKPETPSRLFPQMAQPFLQVVTDPRAAGPHTWVALRSLCRLLESGALDYYQVPMEPLTLGILSCKFEQTDAGADEAVEMAIADVLQLLIEEHAHQLSPNTCMEAFNTVFVTRNTFVHSPALCYHFEQVLTRMMVSVMTQKQLPAQLVLGFVVNQLLHTPLVGGEGLDESTREAQISHDATRVLCLRLTRTAVAVGWASPQSKPASNSQIEATLLNIIQDDLCLSLLMTGQAIWAYHDAQLNISPGFVSLEVLSEICATISSLWNTLALRTPLMTQFETILTGFYTRALVLLRKRKQPHNSLAFNANLVFDSEVEIILESLIDILCLHDHSRSIVEGNGGSLETMFAYYDCHMRRSDVAIGLMVELCRCCGGSVNEDGEAVLSPCLSRLASSESLEESASTASAEIVSSSSPMVRVEHPWRPVPAHLKELCAQTIVGAMKCLFRDDKPSAATMLERSQRQRSIMSRQVMPLDKPTKHVLRDVKSKKRLMRKAARIFNGHSSRGIEFLLDSCLVPDPVTPASVATFLRNGIVVGLDKKSVGEYLGESGKAPVAGKSPPSWERDWFHKEVLQCYCSLFRFEDQSLLDGLRMFLAAFRLPGEAQQIDRILQAFADSCGQVCEENRRHRLFSDDPKRASDAAYLLSFSIIMLNTDRHNTNIREDRKMSSSDFVKNNTDYGRDITEKGKELPREYLESIYQSIRDEEIRTEGEGADGAMTVERWKDVMRGSTEESSDDGMFHPSVLDAEDLTELVLEHTWKPIMSAIGAFWNVSRSRDSEFMSPSVHASEQSRNGMLGVQGARLGMDMAFEMLHGVKQLGRVDIFCKIFTWVCDYTGLLGDYTADAVERTLMLTNSVEAQSAVVVAIQTAIESGEDLNEDAWKRIWSIMFELRDLKLISRGSKQSMQTVLCETDVDLLSEDSRRDWTICLIKGDMDYDTRSGSKPKPKRPKSVFGVFGRALFGSGVGDDETTRVDDSARSVDLSVENTTRSLHEKEELVVWNDIAPSDDEDESPAAGDGEPRTPHARSQSEDDVMLSPGTAFENQLIRESLNMSRQLDMPVTGLERMDEARSLQVTPRARLRRRLRTSCPLRRLILDSRFLEENGIQTLLLSLMELVSAATRSPLRFARPLDLVTTPGRERTFSESSTVTPTFMPSNWLLPISPASEAFAEVIICEIALKNKDRLKTLWKACLQDHYLGALAGILIKPADPEQQSKKKVDPGLEKRITGLVRLSICAIQREDLVNDVLPSWKYILPVNDEQHLSSPLKVLDRHLSEGLWRMVSQADGLLLLNNEGWEGLISLLNWCAKRGAMRKPVVAYQSKGQSVLAEDDPALQAYRSVHFMLNSVELGNRLPWTIIDSIRTLIVAGETRRYPQLSIAALDLLSILHEKKLATLGDVDPDSLEVNDPFWSSFWRKIVETIAEAAEKSSDWVSVFDNSYCSMRHALLLPFRILFDCLYCDISQCVL
jgi:Sec7 domain